MTEKVHWLYRRRNRPKLWAALFLVLALTLLPSFFSHHHGHFASDVFRLDTRFGFYAWYGFVTCAAMVAAAKILGIFLKRDDSYYDD